ncbi:MAG: AraC family transcriptional regulator [Subdoligranulum sp.]|nr:AraC family transcriptional regulator [Subdoligranulum sp.]
MKVGYKAFTGTNNRTEFLLTDFDFIDGNDLLAKLFCEAYHMHVEEKFDGIWFHTIRLKSGDADYELLWHEETGNAIHSLEEKKESTEVLEKRLGAILERLNFLLQKHKEHKET